MNNTLRWGILGTGNIARQFATGVSASRRGTLAAVGSRSQESTRIFGDAYRIAARGDYDSVLNDPAVDAVYVALPNSMHHEWTIKALRAGKHVLCEKPIAANAAQAQEMYEAADRAGRVLVEAFMYRCHPQTHAVLKLIADGAIGRVQVVRSSFCFRTMRTENNIRFSAALAGGALMDIGCYCINLARLVAGEDPVEVRATGKLHSSGVDEVTLGMLKYPGGMLSSFTCGMTLQADNTAYICGTEGYIEVPVPWKPPAQRARHVLARSTPPRMDQPQSKAPPPPPREEFFVDAGVDIYGVEADDFAAIVLDGRPPWMPRDESLGNMRVLDEMRKQIGVTLA